MADFYDSITKELGSHTPTKDFEPNLRSFFKDLKWEAWWGAEEPGIKTKISYWKKRALANEMGDCEAEKVKNDLKIGGHEESQDLCWILAPQNFIAPCLQKIWNKNERKNERENYEDKVVIHDQEDVMDLQN